MVRLGLLHPPLPVFIAEELKHLRKRLHRIVCHIGERPALAVVQEFFACDGHSGHFAASLVWNRPADDAQILQVQISHLRILYINQTGRQYHPGRKTCFLLGIPEMREPDKVVAILVGNKVAVRIVFDHPVVPPCLFVSDRSQRVLLQQH